MEEERDSVSSRRLHLRRPGDFRRLGLPPVRARVRLATRVPGRRPSFGRRLSGRLTRLKAWFLPFLAFFGLYASSSVCVFCGSPGCPVGPGPRRWPGAFLPPSGKGG